MSKQAPHSAEFDAHGNCVSAVDWLGNRFHVGEKVMYCISAGRGQMMAFGEVLKIQAPVKLRNTRVECDPDDPDAIPYPNDQTRFYKKIVVPYEDIKVQIRTLKTSGRWDNDERSKPAWVNPMNITAWNPVGTP